MLDPDAKDLPSEQDQAHRTKRKKTKRAEILADNKSSLCLGYYRGDQKWNFRLVMQPVP